jgi:hypothetical protein
MDVIHDVHCVRAEVPFLVLFSTGQLINQPVPEDFKRETAAVTVALLLPPPSGSEITALHQYSAAMKGGLVAVAALAAAAGAAAQSYRNPPQTLPGFVKAGEFNYVSP